MLRGKLVEQFGNDDLLHLTGTCCPDLLAEHGRRQGFRTGHSSLSAS
jgi:hypothetical protein